MNKENIKTNIYFIIPIALWLGFYGVLLVNGDAFAKLFITMLCIGVAPYCILWIIAKRFPGKAGLCKIGSAVIFTATTLIAAKYFLFSYSAEEAMGLLFLPVVIIGLLGSFILLLPFAAVIFYIRRRQRQRTEEELQ